MPVSCSSRWTSRLLVASDMFRGLGTAGDKEFKLAGYTALDKELARPRRH